MFLGRHKHTIDEKGRVSIPRNFRTELEARSDHAPVLTADDHCLRLFPWDEWEAHNGRIAERARHDPDARDFARLVLMNAVEAPIDKQGRILIPQDLRNLAGLRRDVAVAGMGDTVEIWDAERLEAKLAADAGRMREYEKKFAGLRGERD